MKQNDKMKKYSKFFGGFLIVTALLYFDSSAQAMDFNCTSANGLRSDPQDYVNVRGSFGTDGTLKNVNLSLLDKSDPTEHTLIETAGPVFVETRFRPTANRLKNFDKYVLSREKGDSFQLFLPHGSGLARASITRAFIRISFEDTKPDLEELECTSTP